MWKQSKKYNYAVSSFVNFPIICVQFTLVCNFGKKNVCSTREDLANLIHGIGRELRSLRTHQYSGKSFRIYSCNGIFLQPTPKNPSIPLYPVFHMHIEWYKSLQIYIKSCCVCWQTFVCGAIKTVCVWLWQHMLARVVSIHSKLHTHIHIHR